MGRNRQETPEECTRNAQAMPLAWGGYIIRPSDPKFTDRRQAPNDCGIYAWYTRDCELMYVGRSKAISTRLVQHDKGTNFCGGRPTYYSYRLIPEHLVSGVENAHIRALNPRENMYAEGWSVAFGEELEAAIQRAWREVLPAQTASLEKKYTALAEQIAARL
jgi:hypothetical protein